VSDQLEKAITAHGGSDRWQKLTKLTAQATIGGRLGGILNDVRIEVDPDLLMRKGK
jgi:hypothetical protein